jgi:hypothetical protein
MASFPCSAGVRAVSPLIQEIDRMFCFSTPTGHPFNAFNSFFGANPTNCFSPVGGFNPFNGFSGTPTPWFNNAWTNGVNSPASCFTSSPFGFNVPTPFNAASCFTAPNWTNTANGFSAANASPFNSFGGLNPFSSMNPFTGAATPFGWTSPVASQTPWSNTPVSPFNGWFNNAPTPVAVTPMPVPTWPTAMNPFMPFMNPFMGFWGNMPTVPTDHENHAPATAGNINTGRNRQAA